MKYTPVEVSAADIAFGEQAMKILPAYKDIPEEFKRGSNPWAKWQADWFFKGLSKYPAPREGIDLNTAMRNLKCVMHSWEPQHEHKQAGVAYLASLWFASPDGKEIKAAA